MAAKKREKKGGGGGGVGGVGGVGNLIHIEEDIVCFIYVSVFSNILIYILFIIFISVRSSLNQ